MKVLLLTMNFYNYEIDIYNEFINLGYQVDMFYFEPKHSFFHRFESNKHRNNKVFSYQQNIINLTNEINYDYVIVIVGRDLLVNTLATLKNNHINSKFILYLWDDILRINNFFESKKYYDYIFSFDSKDCLKHNFIFLPLFYCKNFALEPEAFYKYDLYSSVSNHSDRLKILTQILKKYKNKKIFIYFCVNKLELIPLKIKLLRYRKSIKITNKPLSQKENIEFIKQSKAILDIQHPTQCGLTLRTIETIGCNRKLITTNHNIVNYDFYNNNNICVINRLNPEIDNNFFEKEYKKIDNNIYKKYTLSSWIKNIIQLSEK